MFSKSDYKQFIGRPLPTFTQTTPMGTQVGGDHYSKMAIQPVEFIHLNKIPFIEGSVIKYVSRWRSKGGIQDLEKAKHFIEMLIDLETKGMNDDKKLHTGMEDRASTEREGQKSCSGSCKTCV